MISNFISIIKLANLVESAERVAVQADDVLDHDFTKFGLTPSIIFFINIRFLVYITVSIFKFSVQVHSHII